MAAADIHAKSSARKFGGHSRDYLDLHLMMDSSKHTSLSDNRHRALTHHGWFITEVLPKIYGDTLVIRTDVNPEADQIDQEIRELEARIELLRRKAEELPGRKVVSVRHVGEQHILEDFQGKFIPTAQDYLESLPTEDWINNGHKGLPPSAKMIGIFRQRHHVD